MLLPSQPPSKRVWRTKQERGNTGNSQRAAGLSATPCIAAQAHSQLCLTHSERWLVVLWADCGALWDGDSPQRDAAPLPCPRSRPG